MTVAETPWHREAWFTSPWNHDDEVAAGCRACSSRAIVGEVTGADAG